MVTFVNESSKISVPSWVVDLEAFRRWMDSDDIPETGRIWYLKGEVWVDMSKEQIFTHAALKNEIAFVLTGLVKAGQLGLFLPDGVLYSNPEADVGGNPDALFVSSQSLTAGRVQLVEGMEEGYVELEGSPDMVLEVVSAASVQKDTVVLRQAYWEAGVREYWLVDARGASLKFEILKHTAKGYVPARKQGGWLKSSVFGKAFRLTQAKNALGHPELTLAVR
jgi:Uma2 family endonuclease